MRTLFEPTGQGTPAGPLGVHSVAIHDGVVLIPDREVLLHGFYARAGANLVITTPEGQTYIVRGFFLVEPPPHLTDGGLTHIPGALAAQFAGPIGLGQYAAAQGAAGNGQPIGQVRSV